MVLPRSVSGFLVDRLRDDDDGPVPGGYHRFERRRIEVVEVNMGHEHEVGLGQVGEGLASANRIDVDRLAVPLHDERRVVDRVDDQGAVVGGDVVARITAFPQLRAWGTLPCSTAGRQPTQRKDDA